MSKTLHAFYSTFQSIKYTFKDGKDANFVLGRYVTDVLSEIAELQFEVDHRHPHIFVKDGQETIDSDLLDPVAALRAKHFAEFEAMQRTANPDRNMGETFKDRLNVATSRDLGSIAAGGSGAVVFNPNAGLPSNPSLTPSIQEKLAALRAASAKANESEFPVTTAIDESLIPAQPQSVIVLDKPEDQIHLQADPTLSAPDLSKI